MACAKRIVALQQMQYLMTGNQHICSTYGGTAGFRLKIREA